MTENVVETAFWNQVELFFCPAKASEGLESFSDTCNFIPGGPILPDPINK